MTFHDHHQLSGLTDIARKAPHAEALTALCKAVTGRSGFLAGSGHAIRDPRLGNILSMDGRVLRTAGLRADPVLDHFGLSLEIVDGETPLDAKAASAALMLRIGLMLRILDKAHAHLEPRVSFGQKTLKHQMVKDGFARAYAAGVTLQSRTLLRVETGRYDGLAEDHWELVGVEIQAEKLMGGHGYLLDGTHALSYLSMLIASLFSGARHDR